MLFSLSCILRFFPFVHAEVSFGILLTNILVDSEWDEATAKKHVEALRPDIATYKSSQHETIPEISPADRLDKYKVFCDCALCTFLFYGADPSTNVPLISSVPASDLIAARRLQ